MNPVISHPYWTSVRPISSRRVVFSSESTCRSIMNSTAAIATSPSNVQARTGTSGRWTGSCDGMREWRVYPRLEPRAEREHPTGGKAAAADGGNLVLVGEVLPGQRGLPVRAHRLEIVAHCQVRQGLIRQKEPRVVGNLGFLPRVAEPAADPPALERLTLKGIARPQVHAVAHRRLRLGADQVGDIGRTDGVVGGVGMARGEIHLPRIVGRPREVEVNAAADHRVSL